MAAGDENDNSRRDWSGAGLRVLGMRPLLMGHSRIAPVLWSIGGNPSINSL